MPLQRIILIKMIFKNFFKIEAPLVFALFQKNPAFVGRFAPFKSADGEAKSRMRPTTNKNLRSVRVPETEALQECGCAPQRLAKKDF